MIVFKNVEKIYTKKSGQVQALKDINLEISQGDIFGFIGYSGAGKSSLIRMVNMLEVPTAGTILVNGTDIGTLNSAQQREHKKKIGMIFQHFNLLETKTVAQNVAMPLVLTGTDKKEIQQRVEDILAYVGLSDKHNAYPANLSGGQKQRVGIARALINNPDILLCDEATSALDPQTTQSILNLLKQINRDQNITILLVTHEMDVVEQICTRVAVMENGRVIEQGDVLEVFANPQQETTRKFVSTVLNAEIPERVLEGLKSDADVYRLEFLGSSAQRPVVSDLMAQRKVKVNILFANMREISGVVLGSMFVQMTGSNEDIREAVLFLQENGVRVNNGGAA